MRWCAVKCKRGMRRLGKRAPRVRMDDLEGMASVVGLVRRLPLPSVFVCLRLGRHRRPRPAQEEPAAVAP